MLLVQQPVSKLAVGQSPSGPSTTVNPLQAVQLMQPVPTTPVPAGPTLNSSLVDGAALTVVLTGFIGIVKMVLPQLFSTVKQGRAEKFAADRDSRHSEHALEAAASKTMQELITSYSASSLNSNASMTEALVNQVSATLSGIVASQARLVELVSQVASTQAVIAETQRRTVEVLSRVEEQLSARGFTRRAADRAAQEGPRRRLALPERGQ